MVEISAPALREAEEALGRALLNMMGVRPAGSLQRVTERVVRAYLTARARNTLERRMKPETVAMMNLNVGEACVITATCKQNIHGQQKSIRRKLHNSDMKWRIRQTSPGVWRVERLPDGSYNRGRQPWSGKPAFLASLPVGGPEAVAIGARRPFDIISCHNKNKARAILDDQNAEWASRTMKTGGVLVKRIR